MQRRFSNLVTRRLRFPSVYHKITTEKAITKYLVWLVKTDDDFEETGKYNKADFHNMLEQQYSLLNRNVHKKHARDIEDVVNIGMLKTSQLQKQLWSIENYNATRAWSFGMIPVINIIKAGTGMSDNVSIMENENSDIDTATKAGKINDWFSVERERMEKNSIGLNLVAGIKHSLDIDWKEANNLVLDQITQDIHSNDFLKDIVLWHATEKRYMCKSIPIPAYKREQIDKLVANNV